MWNRTTLWIALGAVAGAGLVAATLNFDRAFPVVSLELEADRERIIERSRERAEGEGWALGDARTAAGFGLQDRPAKTYIELEAGGRDAWQEVVEEGDYTPYLWTVRLFEPGRTTEARVRFAPDGDVDGFTLKLPEDEAGPSLAPGDARRLAREAATGRWGVDLSGYREVESSLEVRPGGRTDHAFVYERTGERYGEARFRLRLEVAGDRLSEVRRFVEVPEAFDRRYEEMRSTNELIALLASFGAGVLYLLVGCGVGLFVLLRKESLEWRPALAAGAVVAGLLFAASLNGIPGSWLGYDTAVSEGSFLARQLVIAGVVLVAGTLLFALFFAVAEGLTRHAFGDHPRLWSLWSPEVARSRTVLGGTLGGYLFAVLFVPYTVGFYFLTTRIFGWWIPSDALLQPDLVATPLPWLSAVATALYAGTVEEALFRAVPLAGAALIGTRFGGRRWWIGGALVVQAVIFAAAHANYPQQPSYARVVELFLPALAFGVVYLRFGLLPGVLAHFTYDLAWMSLPIFISSAPGILFDQGVVVVAGLLPLGVAVGARVRRGAREALPEGARNRGRSPGFLEEEAFGEADEPGDGGEEGAGRPAPGDFPGAEAPPAGPGGLRWILPVGVVGLGVWLLAVDPGAGAPEIELTRQEALAAGRDTLEAAGAETGEPWRVLASVRTSRGLSHRYVFREHGPGRYRALVGRYLDGPRWRIRVARFRGTVEERAEEWRAYLDGGGAVVRLRHILPEGAPGDSLPEDDARSLAVEALASRFGLAPAAVREISAEAHQRPARRDWTFTFEDPTVALGEGEARIEIEVAGGEVVDARRLVHVPEEWRREERSREARAGILALISGAFLFLLGAGGVAAAVVRWSRGRFAPRSSVAAAAAVLLLIVLVGAVGYPELVASLETARPISHQLAAALGGMGFAALLLAGALGLLWGLARSWGRWNGARGTVPLAAGASVGLAVAAAGEVAGLGEARRLPAWPPYGHADAILPWLAVPVEAVLSLVTLGIAVTALVVALDRVGRGRVGRLPAVAAGCLLVGLAVGGLDAGETWSGWLLSSAVTAGSLAAVYLAARRWGGGVVPAAVGTAALLEVGGVAWVGAAPGSVSGGVLGAVAVTAAASWWARRLTPA